MPLTPRARLGAIRAPLVSGARSERRSREMLAVESYLLQSARWPRSGRHILASYDESSVVVYQAFDDDIADEAVAQQRFGPAFSLTRMSWVKPNFLWMMYRSGWATKPGQRRILAVRISRAFFERVLATAVSSSYDRRNYSSRSEWQAAVGRSDIRLQWDPDHDPGGQPEQRRAIQLGLQGPTLREYAAAAIVGIDDITAFVREQRQHAVPPFAKLESPVERVYTPAMPEVGRRLGVDSFAPNGAD